MERILFKIINVKNIVNPINWDNVLRCISNQMEITNGGKKVQQGREVAKKEA